MTSPLAREGRLAGNSRAISAFEKPVSGGSFNLRVGSNGHSQSHDFRPQSGAALVERAGLTMRDIVARVQEVSELIGHISNASDEQTEGLGQVNAAVGQLDNVTQQNAALVEESAAAAESLDQQARKLVQAVAVFRLQAA